MFLHSITKCIKLFILSIIIIWVLITITDHFLITDKLDSKNFRPEGKRTLIEEIQRNHKTHIILFWTKYFQQSIESYLDYKLTINSEFCSGVVPYVSTSCVVTSDRAYLTFSKALVFHWRDLNVGDLPPYRSLEQLWTIYNLEAPTHTNNIFANGLSFNITSSYRSDSDIFVPYGRLTKINPNKSLLKPIDFESKTKQIVWFVSNCETPSKRELYVHELSRYIPVDIYGKCGPLSCDPPRSQRCFQKVTKEYKFYLSFENSICRDYVTEKLFEALNYDIIPVVFGGHYYKSSMPYNSYIDANLLTPKQLAQQLIQIGNNRQKYLSYFQWKQHFSVLSGLDQKFEIFCHLCKILNNSKKYSGHSSNELNYWWFKTSKCKSWVSSANNTNRYTNVF